MIKNELLSKYSPTATDPEKIGFLVKGEVHEVPNIAPEPTKGTMVNPVDILHFVEELSAEATWHTHPGGPSNLSGDDYLMFKMWPDMDHYIVGSDGVRCYRYNRNKQAVIENE